ncbi:MAG: FkbM family methyltransferase [Eubacterium sp.]|nr:FkbM family methyltransferase [Eubacterium sp.]
MSDFINLFEEMEYMDVYEELKEQELPLMIWGAGELASEVAQCLEDKHIAISDYVVDDNFYDNSPVYISARIKYSDAVKKYGRFNVVLGHSNYELYKDIEKKDFVGKVFILPFVNYTKWDKTNLSEIRVNRSELEHIYSILEDEKSRSCFVSMLKTHVSGNPYYCIKECDKQMTFFRNDIFAVGEDEVFLDVGAFDGDTLRMFLAETGERYKEVICIEPDDISRKKLEDYINNHNYDNITVISEGVWNCKGTLFFADNQEQISSVSDEQTGTTINVDRIDNIVKGATLIKINYLFGVAEALEGAERILAENRPKLAITCGFNCTNIIGIVNSIIHANTHYKLYLRFNRGMVSTLTLYGV